MRLIIQRVLSEAKVIVNDQITGIIDKGLVILLGVEEADTSEDISWLCRKVVNLRIFNDTQGKMNLSIQEISGSILIVSQFTLFASTKKGNRPSYLRSAKPEKAEQLYNEFINHLKTEHTIETQAGVFGADMKLHLINDGPVTIFIDSKNKE